MKKFNNKKGQGALEFLMTYGWAFLVIIIMIGALAYFGVLDPQRFLPDRCQFGANVACRDNAFIINAAAANTIVASLVNNFGSNVIVYDAVVNTDAPLVTCAAAGSIRLHPKGDGAASAVDVATTAGTGTLVWEDGESAELQVDCLNANTNLQPGDKAKFQIAFKWYSTSAGSSYTKDAAGEIFSTVQ